MTTAEQTAVRPGGNAAALIEAPQAPSARAILNWPLPELCLLDRVLARGAALLARRKVRSITGIENILPGRDPFILALNHSTRQEALLVPPLLVLLRSGRRIHFLADWNFRLIPGVGLLYRRAGAITVPRKPARPRFLTALRPLFADDLPPSEQARRHLLAGRSIGIFPEGTVNRDSARLLRGRHGAARLSLETGAPVVPVGLRFPSVSGSTAIPDGSPMEIDIGPPLPVPPTEARVPTPENVVAWHGRIMTAIGQRCGKSWKARTQETSNEDV
jgi:1-acyl-sn-glycerol-3-phosphate acyltransferase